VGRLDFRIELVSFRSGQSNEQIIHRRRYHSYACTKPKRLYAENLITMRMHQEKPVNAEVLRPVRSKRSRFGFSAKTGIDHEVHSRVSG
jgi:hypothetical protein